MSHAPISLFTHDEPGPRFAIKDVTAVLVAAGLPYPTANARVAAYAKKGLIHVREKGVATQPNRFALSDMAAAVVLSALQDAGIADHEVLQAASLSLYAWTQSSQTSATTHHPITQALLRALDGGSVRFDLQFLRDARSGQRIIDAALTAEGDERHSSVTRHDAMVATAAVVVALDRSLQPVLQHLRRVVGN